MESATYAKLVIESLKENGFEHPDLIPASEFSQHCFLQKMAADADYIIVAEGVKIGDAWSLAEAHRSHYTPSAPKGIRVEVLTEFSLAIYGPSEFELAVAA